MVRDASHIEVQTSGMACKPSQSRQPPFTGSRKLYKTVFFHFALRLSLQHRFK